MRSYWNLNGTLMSVDIKFKLPYRLKALGARGILKIHLGFLYICSPYKTHLRVEIFCNIQV